MEYRITNVQQRDIFKTQYGEMQAYAIALEGRTGWHQLNQMVSTPPPRIGDTITGTITDEMTKNGEPFKKFKKQNPKFAGQNAPVPNDKLDYIISMLEKLTGTNKQDAPAQTMTDEELKMDNPFPNL